MQILLFGSCAVVTFYLVALFIKIAYRFNLIDKPTQIKTHIAPTPRGCGVLIVPMISIFYLLYSKFIFGSVGSNAIIVSSLLIIMPLLFFVEDIFGIPILFRMLIQSVAIGVGMFVLRNEISNDILTFIPNWIKFPMIFFGWLWFTNLYNFMDGINGITGCQTVFISLAMIFCISFFHDFKKNNHDKNGYQVSVYAEGKASGNLTSDDLQGSTGLLVGMVICLSVFLHFNRTPSKVFIGDSGSISLGFILGYLLIKFGIEFGIIPALIIPLYYIMDSGVTILLRLKNGEKIWLPHNKHFFQYAKRSGMPDGKICALIFVVNLLLLALSVLSIYFRSSPIIITIAFFVSLCAVFSLMFYFYRIYVKNSNSIS